MTGAEGARQAVAGPVPARVSFRCLNHARLDSSQPADRAWMSSITPIVPVAAPAAPPRRLAPHLAALHWDGRSSRLFAIGLGNLLLSLLTLGTYRFWGVARMRRVIWAHQAFLGDRAEYTGTGGELFRGFLKAMLVLVPLLMAAGVLETLAAVDKRLAWGFAAAKLAGLVYLAGVARHAARRYLASRTRWRAIRFALAGSPWRFGLVSLGWTLLTVATLGLARPWAVAAEARWTLGRLHLGTEPVRFEGRGIELLRPHLVALLFVAFVTAAAWLAIAAPVAAALHEPLQAYLARADLPPEGKAATRFAVLVGVPLLAAMVLASPAVLVAWFSVAARVMRWRAEGTVLGGARFAMPEVTGWQVAWLRVGNGLLLLLSLGLLRPVTLARDAAFWAEHLVLDREPDLSGVRQAARGPGTGEGMADMLSVGSFGA
jgi:uncharacterized membrane protein YjgN (DUF898 family)